MIARKLSSVVLVVIPPLACMQCQPAVDPHGGSQVIACVAQAEGRPKAALSESDDDLSRVHLLNSEAVQTDLGLTEAQIGQLRDFRKAYRERSRKYLAEARKIFPSSRSFSPEELMAEERSRVLLLGFLKDSRDLQARLIAMLAPSQRERLKQIQLQTAIPAVLAWPEVIKALDISEEQSAKIDALRDGIWRKVYAVKWPDLSHLDAQKRLEKAVAFYKALDQIQVEAGQRMLDVLTLEQRRKFEELHGKKINVMWPNDTLTPEDIELADFMRGWML